MNQKVKVGGHVVTVTDRQYKAAGGEAAVYVFGNEIYKLYHEPDKKMIPPQKIAELSAIQNTNVIRPLDIIYDATSGQPLGYSMKYLDGAEPLVKFFTKAFKIDNNLDPKMIAELIRQTQLIVLSVHATQCLIVDLNELNVLVKLSSVLEPYFIDVDSYQTPTYRATAIMDSIRDRTVKYNQFTQLSDWFSWGVLAFWAYTNIHPFRGSHPNYKPREKSKQMDDGISVFHKGVRVPPTTNDFKIIPPRHLAWFQAVFKDGERSAPPLPDSTAPMPVPAAIVMVTGTDKFEVAQVASYPEDILSLFVHFGVRYAVTNAGVYSFEKIIVPFTRQHKNVVLCTSSNGALVIAVLKGQRVTFVDVKGKEIGSIASTDIFARNNCVYTVANGKLSENSFTVLADKLVHRINQIENVSTLTTTIYDGCLIQDLLGKKYVTLPYAKGRCFSKPVPEMNPFRIVNAKADKNVVVVIGEKSGSYSRFVLVFDKTFTTFTVRETADIAYDAINFTVSDMGVVILLASPAEVELFMDNNSIGVTTNPPFDASMRLFGTPDGIMFASGNTLHSLKSK